MTKPYIDRTPPDKGIIELDYRPTMCCKCLKVLSNTFTLRDSPFEGWLKYGIHIFCDECYKKEFGK